MFDSHPRGTPPLEKRFPVSFAVVSPSRWGYLLLKAAGPSGCDFAGGLVVTQSFEQFPSYTSEMTICGTKGALHRHRMGQGLSWQAQADPAPAMQGGIANVAVAFEVPRPNPVRPEDLLGLHRP